jgi:hypothetical protein
LRRKPAAGAFRQQGGVEAAGEVLIFGRKTNEARVELGSVVCAGGHGKVDGSKLGGTVIAFTVE